MVEHWVEVDGSNVFVWQKSPEDKGPAARHIVFVHGSSMASRPTFDLQVEGRPYSSVMDWFVDKGFNTWCFDSRGYGNSDKPNGFKASISEGAEDLASVVGHIKRFCDVESVDVYGVSSGALKAALFAERHPEWVRRLALDAYVWTGKDSPTLRQRRKKLGEFKSTERRPIDHEFVHSVFERDHPGVAEERVVNAFAEAILALDDSMPNGTYVDMCENLPINRPERITVPTLLMRGEYDGIADLKDLLEFFERLPNPDKQFTMMPGVSHASFQQKNYLMVYEILCGFLGRSSPVYSSDNR